MARVRSVVRLVRRRPGAADAVLAVALAAYAQLEIWTLGSTDAPRAVLAATALSAMLALAWRRSAPLASATVTLGAIALLSAFWRLDGAWPAFAFLVALYSVAMHSELRAALIGGALGLTAGALGTLAEDNDSIGAFVGNYFLLAVAYVGMPWVGGRALRSRRLRAEALEDRDQVMALYLPDIQRSISRDEVPALMLEHARRLLRAVGYGSNEEPFVEVGIGMDLGEAFVGNIGERALYDFTAVGDVVNTASRLQGRAAGGEAMLSERVADGLPAPVGTRVELSLKGKSAPETAYRVNFQEAA